MFKKIFSFLFLLSNYSIASIADDQGVDLAEQVSLPNLFTAEEGTQIQRVLSGGTVDEDIVENITDFLGYFNSELDNTNLGESHRFNLKHLESNLYPIDIFIFAKYDDFMEKTNAEFMVYYLRSITKAFISDAHYTDEDSFLYNWVEALDPLTRHYIAIVKQEEADPDDFSSPAAAAA